MEPFTETGKNEGGTGVERKLESSVWRCSAFRSGYAGGYGGLELKAKIWAGEKNNWSYCRVGMTLEPIGGY